MRDAFHMLFAVQGGLIQVRDRPALRNIEAEFSAQRLGGLAGHGVLPCPERRQQVPVLIKGEIAVHHAGDAHGGNLTRQLAEILNCGAKACLHLVHVVCPDAVFQTAFPGIVAALYDLVRFVEQNGLDAGRAELNAEKIVFHACTSVFIFVLAREHKALHDQEQTYHSSNGDICPPRLVKTE